jgi:pimeloyl-ACP methyl ester carboxylesterase
VGYRRLQVDGGTIEYVVGGPVEARDLLVFHVGTPSAAVAFHGLTRAAGAAGMRTLIYSRPGYGRSTRRPGRTVADQASISAALADHLGYRQFYTVGWSGGGPVALACAALLPDRVRACVTLAAVAPWVEVGDEFVGWLAPDDISEWRTLATGDTTSLHGEYQARAAEFRQITPRRYADFPGTPDADRKAALDPAGIGRPVARSIRRAMASGIWGWLDDAVAVAGDWGFRVADIRVPVVVRQGEVDQLVNGENGRWLAGAIPGARGVFLPDVGHTAVTQPWEDVVQQLREAAR